MGAPVWFVLCPRAGVYVSVAHLALVFIVHLGVCGWCSGFISFVFMCSVAYFHLCMLVYIFVLVSFTLAHLRMLSFVFSNVCVLGRSYTYVVVSCLGSLCV